MQDPHKCKFKFKKLYKLWQNLSKSINKMNEVLINKGLVKFYE